MKYNGYNRFTQYSVGLISLAIVFLLIVVNCVIYESFIWGFGWLVAMFVTICFTANQIDKRKAFLEALNQVDWLEFKTKNGKDIPVGA